MLLLVLGVWVNHFESGFHGDDIHTIVENKSLDDLVNIPRFFIAPRLSADEPQYAYYSPLLTADFALDRRLSDKPAAPVYQVDTFIWFLLQMIALYFCLALIPNVNHVPALTAAVIFAMHPAIAVTLNYALHRGHVIALLSIASSLALWIFWPRRLPARIVYFDGVPKSDWDEFRRVWGPRINKRYQAFIQKTSFLYLVPIVFGLLADPSTAAFAPILVAYVLCFDRGKTLRTVTPAAALCGAYWIFQTVFSWRYAAGQRIPFLPYLVSQPLAIADYFCRFFVPANISVVSDLPVAAHFWSPPALLGYAGLAAIVFAAIAASRREAWRPSAFGLWWFLAAAAVSSLPPQHAGADYARMYIAMAGLAYAATSAVLTLISQFAENADKRFQALAAASALLAIVVAALGWVTYAQNRAWISESALWDDATAKSPRSPIAFVNYAVAQNTAGATADAYANLLKATALKPDDPVTLLALARAFDSLGKDAESERYFRMAVDSPRKYSPAYSYYAEWLLLQRRYDEAFRFSNDAIRMNPWDLRARHALMQIYSAGNHWPDVKRVAEETLALDPHDQPALNARDLAVSVAQELHTAEKNAEQSSNVNSYLKLSVAYYQNRRFEDSIKACQQAIALRPDLAEAYSNMAAAEYALGRIDATEAALRQALKFNPRLRVVRNNLDFIEWLKTQPGRGNPAQAAHPQ